MSHYLHLLKTLLPGISLIFIIGLSSTAHGFSVTLKGVGLGRFVGHEEVSRQAIIMTKKVAESEGLGLSSELLAEMTDIQKLPMGMEAVITKNPLVLGNRAADQPDAKVWPVDIRSELGFKSKIEEPSLLKWGGARSFHFTLNEYELGPFTSDKKVPTIAGTTTGDFIYDTPRESCEFARDKITLFTEVGMNSLAERETIDSNSRANRKSRKALLRKALFSFGVATHVLQDSFSPSHTFRAPQKDLKKIGESDTKYGNFDLIDVCYYDQVISHIYDGGKKVISSVLTQDWIKANSLIQTPAERLSDFTMATKPCAHRKNDLDDYIWMRTLNQKSIFDQGNWSKWDADILNDPDVRSSFKLVEKKIKKVGLLKYCQDERRFSSNASAFACIKQESRLARTATIKYFLTLLTHIKNVRSTGISDAALSSDKSKSELKKLLASTLFEGSLDIKKYGLNEIMSEGVMRCSKLSNRRFIQKENGDFYIQK